MRIITGRWRGRRIAAPDGDETRPILDRAKTVLFDVLGHRLAEPGRLPPIAVLDLFAGSGALGLEALSRGARYCLLVEMCRGTARLIRQNLDTLHIVSEAEVLQADVFTSAFPWPPAAAATESPSPNPQDRPAGSRSHTGLGAGSKEGADATAAGYELVFVDPPYRLLNRPQPDPDMRALLAKLASEPVILDSATIVVRHPYCAARPPDLAPLVELDRRDVGKCTLRFMARPAGGAVSGRGRTT